MYREEREKKSRMVNVGSDDATALQILHSLLLFYLAHRCTEVKTEG